MSALTLFIIEILLCFGISITVVLLIKPLLREVLIDTCGTPQRAEFWVMFTHLMLVISPLLIVIYFAPTDSSSVMHTAEAMKDTLFRSLLGLFIALAMVGQVIWKSTQLTIKETFANKSINDRTNTHEQEAK